MPLPPTIEVPAMNKANAFILLACLALAAGCSRDAPSTAHSPQGAGSTDRASRTLGKVAAQVRSKLESQNIKLESADERGKAEITPQGDLIVEGSQVAVDAAQRKLLLQYRASIIDIAAAGTDIGMQGADFGMRTAGKALRGVLSGNSDQVDEEIEADARKFEAHARRICDHFPALLEAQQQLVAQLPQFAPYAKMEQSDIDDCLEGEESATDAPAP
jgi:hypothetical protein